jgi:hypothetical protein
MALDPSDITSYSPENGVASRKPQFNASPETLYDGGKVPGGTGYLDRGAMVQTPAEIVPVPVPAPVPVIPTPKAEETTAAAAEA